MKRINKNAIYIREVTTRYKVAKTEGEKLKISSDVQKVAKKLLQNLTQETMIILCLDSANKIQAYAVVGIGTISSCLTEPRDLFRFAISANAAKIIIAHNHPSGDPLPSRDDVKLTKRIAMAGELLGIPLLDHVIIGDHDNYSSLRDMGLIPNNLSTDIQRILIK